VQAPSREATGCAKARPAGDRASRGYCPACENRAMEGLTPASADDLPPLGELVVDDPFWRFPAGGVAREGAGHLRVWETTTATPGYMAVVTETGDAASVTESAGLSGPSWPAGSGLRSCCSSTTSRPSSARGWRPSIWSASAPTGARTGHGGGRPRRKIPVMPGSSCGWPTMGTGSSAGRRARSTGAKTRAADRRRVTGKPGQRVTEPPARLAYLGD